MIPGKLASIFFSLLTFSIFYPSLSYANLSLEVTSGQVYFLAPLSFKKVSFKQNKPYTLPKQGSLEILPGAAVKLTQTNGTMVQIRTPGIYPLAELALRDIELENYLLKTAVSAKPNETAIVNPKPDLFFKQAFLRRIVSMLSPAKLAEQPKRLQDQKEDGIDHAVVLEKIEIVYPTADSSFPWRATQYLDLYFIRSEKSSENEEIEVFLWMDGTIRSQSIGSTRSDRFAIPHPSAPGIYYLQLMSKNMQSQSDMLRLRFGGKSRPDESVKDSPVAARDRMAAELSILSPKSGEVFVPATARPSKIPLVIAAKMDLDAHCNYDVAVFRAGEKKPVQRFARIGSIDSITLGPGIYMGKIRKNCPSAAKSVSTELRFDFRVAHKNDLAKMAFAQFENHVTFLP